MPCRFCQYKQTQYSDSFYFKGEELSHTFSLEPILTDYETIWSRYGNDGVYRCRDCSSVWSVRTGEMREPRDTYPFGEYLKAVKLEGDLLELAKKTNLENLLKVDYYAEAVPYGFTDHCVEAIGEKQPHELKSFYESLPENINDSFKRKLDKWYQEAYPEEYREMHNQGFYLGFEPLFRLEENQRILRLCFFDVDRFAFLVEDSSGDAPVYLLIAYGLKDKKALWHGEIPHRPFEVNQHIKPLQWNNDYLTVFQIRNLPAPGTYHELVKPDWLSIYDLEGNLIHERELKWKCYEVLATGERGYSENRTVHNFRMTILDNILYLGENNDLVAYDLANQEEIWRLPLQGEVFSGGIQKESEETMTAFLLKGMIQVSPEGELKGTSIQPFHPVFISAGFDFVSYYAQLYNALSGRKTQINTQSDYPIPETLKAVPVQIGEILMLPCSRETVFVDAEYREVARYPFSVPDRLGPHAYGQKGTAPFQCNGYFVLPTADNFIQVCDVRGELFSEIACSGDPEKVFTFDGLHIAVLARLEDFYGGEKFSLSVYDLDGTFRTRVYLSERDILWVGFHWHCVTLKDDLLVWKDLYTEKTDKT
jgi:hypothetical protein